MFKQLQKFLGLFLILSLVAAFFFIPFFHKQTAFASHLSSDPAFLFADVDHPAYASQDTLSATGFAPNETVTLLWDYQQQDQQELGNAEADSQGQAVFNITVPSEPDPGNVPVAAIGDTSHLIATTTVFESAAVLINPSEGHQGDTVDIRGGGFGSQETVTVFYQGKKFESVTTNDRGAFHTTFTIPSTAVGIITIRADGSNSGASARSQFTVAIDLAITPDHGPSGTIITLTAQTHDILVDAIIYWVDPSTDTQTYLTSVQSSASGGFYKTQITAPTGLVPGNSYIVRMLDTRLGVTAEVPFLAQ